MLSAEGRLSAWILTCCRSAWRLLINLVNPRFMAVLWTDPLGIKLVVGALVLMVLGIFWMRRSSGSGCRGRMTDEHHVDLQIIFLASSSWRCSGYGCW